MGDVETGGGKGVEVVVGAWMRVWVLKSRIWDRSGIGGLAEARKRRTTTHAK